MQLQASDVEEMLKQKFGIVGTREGNTIRLDALMKQTHKLARVVIVLGDDDRVKGISVYPWNPEFTLPGTKRIFTELLDRFF